jgi:L-seryl-tRNA(Ser) seleniumtransferase
VNLLLQSDQGKKLIEDYSHEIVVQGIREGIDRLRSGEVELAEEKKQIQEDILKMTRGIIEEKFALSLRRTINGTGTIIHTNLGRAKLSPSVKDALLEVAFSFSNLEYNIDEGSRGSRYQHLEEMLCDLTGAGGALVVNNNAAAIMLALDTVAKGREVIVSRGELVEIGGSFRIPEIIELSGCKLKEVGTTNKTHEFDYQTAINEDTAAVLKVHSSNYKISGFTKSVSVDELSILLQEKAKPTEIPLIHDMGSGMLINLEKYGLPYEMTVRESLEAGADIVTFSGDKVLGGPQAGIILGKKKYIDAMKKNQLTRALRVDKMTIATLEATLRLYYDQEEALKQIPTLNMLVISLEELEEKAKALAEKLSILGDKVKVEVLDTTSQVGGGAYPGEEISSKAVVISTDLITANQLSESLRKAPVPIISKIRNQKCELDVRTIDIEEFSVIVERLVDIFSRS